MGNSPVGPADFRLPSLGADMEEGTVIEWRVAPGDTVRKGDVLLAVETEKSDIDVETWHDGVMVDLLVGPGDTVQVGTVIAHLLPAGADIAPTSAPETQRESTPPSPRPAETHPGLVTSPLVRHLAEHAGVDVTGVTGTGVGGRVTRHDVEAAQAPGPGSRSRPAASPLARRPAATPLARRIAQRHGIDLATVPGSGPAGAVLRADVDRVAAQAPVAPPASAASTEPATDRARAMRQAIARQMARSKQEIPHYYLWSELDLSAPLARLAAENDQRPITARILPAALLLHATAAAAAAHPDLNGHWIDGELRTSPTVDLGVVVALRGGGLAAPVIADAASCRLDELMGQLKDLVGRARAGRLRSSDIRPASLTVTNLGDLGGDAVLGVIHPPQVAIVGFGHVTERPVVVDGDVVARPTVTVSLAADHRASDGMRGARFLHAIDTALQSYGANPPTPSPQGDQP